MISARVLLLFVSLRIPAIVWCETCEPCVTVKGDSSDALVGEYRLIGEEPLCTEYPCSYTKVGGNQGDVYCFQSGDYTTALDECSSLPTTAPTTPGTTLPPTSIDSSEKVTETLENIGSRKSELEAAAASVSGETKEQIEEVTTELDKLTVELDGYQIDLNSDDRVRRQARPRCERFGRILIRLNRMTTLLEKVVGLLSNILSSLARNNVIIGIITDIKDFLDGLLSDTRIEVMRIEKRKEKCEGQSGGLTTPEVEGETSVGVTTPDGEGESPVEITSPEGETPVPVTTPEGETPVQVTTPEGETPVPVTTPEGETPVPVTTPEGETAVPITTPEGETPVPVTTPDGETPVPTTPDGERPVELTSMGETTKPGTPMGETTGAETPMGETTGAETTMEETTGAEGTTAAGTPAPTVAPGTTAASGSAGFTTEFCNNNPGHTMCKYTGLGSVCTADANFIRGYTTAGKDLILQKHNELRSKVAQGNEAGQPAATNMRRLVWNDELEAVAQRWADQCTFGHDSSRNKVDGTYVGQNAYISMSSQTTTQEAMMSGMDGAVQAWYDEVTDPGFNSANIDPYVFSSGTGHYTQVVWAETTELGCGWSYYKEGGWQKSLVVCNYAKGGNMMGGTMYEAGTSCDNCPTGTTCDADKLCA